VETLRRRERWPLKTAIILLATLAVYAPVLRGGFLWDDDKFLTQNPMIASPDGLYRLWFTTEPTDYFPLTSTLFWVQWRVWGMDPTGYHVVNVLLHALAAMLVWRVLTRLKAPGAYLGALIFAVHPVMVSSVAWITELKNTLSIVPFLLSVLAYLRFEERPKARWYAVSLAAFMVALLAKPSMVMMPAVLLLLAWHQRGRLAKADWLRSMPFFAMSLVLGLVTMWFQHHNAMVGEDVRPEGLASAIASTGWAAWFYLGKVLLPVDLMMVYPRWTIDGGVLSFVPLAMLVAAMASLWAWRRHPLARASLTGMGYFILTLGPVLGLVKMSFMVHSLVADHLQYISTIGVIALVAGVVATLWRRLGPSLQKARWVAGGAIVLLLAAMSQSRARVFASQETLWGDNIARNPSAWVAWHNLAVLAMNDGQPAQAVAMDEKALALREPTASVHYGLGVALNALGHRPEAIAHLRRSLQLDPSKAGTHCSLGEALAGQGDLDEAAAQCRCAIALAPDYAQAFNSLGLIVQKQGKADEAAELFRRALEIDDNCAAAHLNYANLLLSKGDVQGAALHYRQRLLMGPPSLAAHVNLGFILAGAGQWDAAAREYRAALEIDPACGPALAGLRKTTGHGQ
jgi:tetratricopeptide (TPR) repeat protein